MSKKHVKENASGSASGAGAIAATPGALGSKPGKKGKKKQDSIFAVSEEDLEEIALIRRRAGLTDD